jgi:C4-dicarboxylate transporter
MQCLYVIGIRKRVVDMYYQCVVVERGIFMMIACSEVSDHLVIRTNTKTSIYEHVEIYTNDCCNGSNSQL